MKKQLLYLLAIGLVVITGCQKELSFEGDSTPAEGSLQSDINGDCLPKSVNGVYVAAKPLAADTNTISVSVNVVKTGSYVISSDTVNGYFFRATGIFTTPGVNTVTLRGNGTPFAAGVNNFVITFDSTVCDIQVTVLPAGAGGPATFTLVNGGTPANCASAVVNGTYTKDVALTAANTVDITVNVTAIGTYSITASGGGMTFTKTGAFLTTGNQTINLIGAGTPTTAGANTITFAAPFASCNFTIDVVGPAVYTIDCPNVVVSGIYQQGINLGAGNIITLPVTVSTAGGYNISASINGMTFTGSGTLTTSSTSIVLTGVSTTSPTTAGTFNLSVGTPTCSIPITCTAAPVIDWSFKIGTTTYSGSTSDVVGIDVATFPPFRIVDYYGEYGGTPDLFNLTLGDPAGGIITAGETYNTNFTTLVNGAYFYFDGLPGLELEATDPTTTPGVNIVVTITSHDTSTKTIIGTFSGSAFDYVSNSTKTITNGTFKIVYPN